MVQHFNKESFETALKSSETVLVDFWATWCGPCRMMAPIIEDIAEKYDGKIIIGKVDVDEEQELAQQYGIMSIPTLMIFKHGVPVSTSVGVRPEAYVEELINQNL